MIAGEFKRLAQHVWSNINCFQIRLNLVYLRFKTRIPNITNDIPTTCNKVIVSLSNIHPKTNVNIGPNVLISTALAAPICRMVSSGVGIGLLPYDSISYYNSENISIIEIDEKLSKRNLTLCIKKNAMLGTLTKTLFDHLKGESSA